MPQMLYCWRCRQEVPMLDEREWELFYPAMGVQGIQHYRQLYQVSLKEAMERFEQPVLDAYFELTGYRETSYNALWHHRLSLYGPPCSACGKPLRTGRARFCAACGYKREITSPPSLPDTGSAPPPSTSGTPA